jgi:hypothetical protein
MSGNEINEIVAANPRLGEARQRHGVRVLPAPRDLRKGVMDMLDAVKQAKALGMPAALVVGVKRP